MATHARHSLYGKLRTTGGEWKGTSPQTRRILAVAMAMVLISVIILNLGGLF
jgi:hypothetical protein